MFEPSPWSQGSQERGEETCSHCPCDCSLLVDLGIVGARGMGLVCVGGDKGLRACSPLSSRGWERVGEERRKEGSVEREDCQGGPLSLGPGTVWPSATPGGQLRCLGSDVPILPQA